MKRRIPLAPEEGWLTLGLVLLICLTLAWSVDAVRWVLGRQEYLDYLVLAAAGGVLVGFIGPKVGWGRWLTYLIGCVFAALIVPLLTGLVQYPHAPLGELYRATANASVQAYIDIVIRARPATTQFLHHVMIFGLLIWATSMFASYAVFGHRRPLNAVVMVGLLLVLNMASTREDQLPLLVLYSVASLFLLIRGHVFDEQSEWLRRRIGDPGSISSVYLRGGTIFITATVVAAFVLTMTAASAPLAGAWSGVGDGLIALSRSVSKYLPTGGTTREVGLTFGPDQVVGREWNNNDLVAARIQRTPSDTGTYYWRAIVYDKIDLGGWGWADTSISARPAGSKVLDGLPDNVDPTFLHQFNFTVTPDTFHLPTILSPETPFKVDTATKLTYVGSGYFTTLDRDGGSGSYEVSAFMPTEGDDPGELNDTMLRATPTTYPDDIKRLYLAPQPAGMLGTNALKLEARVRAEAASTAPVDRVNRLRDILRSPEFTYDTDVRDLDCSSLSIVECFATYKRGFCQYYAPTMAVILRDIGIPTRIAQGFLPGTLDKRTGLEEVRNNNAHAWVEVYYQGVGWVTYDPTGLNTPNQIGPLPSGKPLPSGSAGASSSAGVRPSLPIKGEKDEGPSGSVGSANGGSLGPLIAVGALLLLLVVAVAFIVWQRGPRGTTTPEAAYGTVTRLAARLGFGPRPAQTVYEFAGSLSEVLPGSRPEIETVALAKVESSYGRATLGDERVAQLLAAQRRLRISLLRLLFHRRERPRRRRR